METGELRGANHKLRFPKGAHLFFFFFNNILSLTGMRFIQEYYFRLQMWV